MQLKNIKIILLIIIGWGNSNKKNDATILVDMQQEALSVNLLSRKRRRKKKLSRAQRNQMRKVDGVIEESMCGLEIEDEEDQPQR